MSTKNDIQLIKISILAILMCYFVLWLTHNFGEFSFFAASILLLVFVFGLLMKIETRIASIHNMILMIMLQNMPKRQTKHIKNVYIHPKMRKIMGKQKEDNKYRTDGYL
ncbi:MAG: hypothetical protein Q6363_003660 [Candidatus Njordarchaeota archaeon]